MDPGLLLNRAAKGVLDRLLGWRVASSPMARVGRYVVNRVNGDNDGDMTSNGELALVRQLQVLIPEGVTSIFDVGANLGQWTLLAGAHLPVNSVVYAFEPVSGLFAELERNVTELALGRVMTVKAALSDADGEGEMWLHGGGASAFCDRNVRPRSPGSVCRERVRLMRGDTFCRDHSIARIGFLKIDVEGHELAVLRGFSQMLGQGRIDALQFEYGGTWIDARCWLKDAFHLLRGYGYLLGKLLPSGVRWHPQYEPNLESFQYANYIATRPVWRERLVGMH